MTRLLLMISLLFAVAPMPVGAFSASSSSLNNNKHVSCSSSSSVSLSSEGSPASTRTTASSSPWAPAEWRIDLNFGREPGTYMPESWGASGARLVLPMEVLIESSPCRTTEEGGGSFMGGSSGKADRLYVLEDSSFISSKGQEIVPFAEEGAWKILTRRTGKMGDAGTLRFYFDIASLDKDGEVKDYAAKRNDVTIQAERYYCSAKCWRESELEKGKARIRPIQQALERAQASLDARLPHDTGDRRLDGTNPIDTAMASIDMAVLVKKRDDLLNELRQAERTLPSSKGKLSDPGMWPGTSERLIVAPGKITVKRKAGDGSGLLSSLGGEEYHIVGSWSATPLEGLSEFYDDDEEESENE